MSRAVTLRSGEGPAQELSADGFDRDLPPELSVRLQVADGFELRDGSVVGPAMREMRGRLIEFMNSTLLTSS